MLLSLYGSALFRPCQSLQMDAEALRQLNVKRNTHKPTGYYLGALLRPVHTKEDNYNNK